MLMKKIIPFLFAIAIFSNIALLLFFKLRIDRQYKKMFVDYQEMTTQNICNLTSNALARIDYYFFSNVVDLVRGVSSDSSLSSFSSSTTNSPLLPVVSQVSYKFYKIDHVPFVRIGIDDYTVGDFWPQGGVITSVTPFCIVLNGSHVVQNSLTSTATSSSSTTFSLPSPPLTEQRITAYD